MILDLPAGHWCRTRTAEDKGADGLWFFERTRETVHAVASLARLPLALHPASGPPTMHNNLPNLRGRTRAGVVWLLSPLWFRLRLNPHSPSPTEHVNRSAIYQEPGAV
ncbi:hypothetical protein EDB85DRAFT_2139919 [Lactarius pseudohatsudake]|nr:hypothetical protein EDB85DRAFT_2139919 [Lactarius pseudohatsudake]